MRTPLALAIAALALATAAPALTADTTPFRASIPITFASAAVPSPCSLVRVDVHGLGNATHLGRFESAEWYHCFDPARPLEFTDGRYTFTAADGSTIHGSYFGRFLPTSDPSVLSIDGRWTIAGGTGRFRGASGGGVATGTSGAAAGVLVLDGRISRP
jgi:hypothetical protein